MHFLLRLKTLQAHHDCEGNFERFQTPQEKGKCKKEFFPDIDCGMRQEFLGERRAFLAQSIKFTLSPPKKPLLAGSVNAECYNIPKFHSFPFQIKAVEPLSFLRPPKTRLTPMRHPTTKTLKPAITNTPQLRLSSKDQIDTAMYFNFLVYVGPFPQHTEWYSGCRL
jgi:hypothetical protein